MTNRIHPKLRRLERGQGALEYGLMILLVAIVAVPVVAILAPSDFRQGAIYQRVYIPFLCAIQGRDATTCAGTLGGGEAYSFGFPTADGEKELGESGGGGPGGGGPGGGGDVSVLEVTSLVVTGESQAILDPSDYTVTAQATGGADSLTITLNDGSSDVFSETIGGDSEYEVTGVDDFVTAAIAALQTEGDYTLTAVATKDGTDSDTETLSFSIVDPDGSDNLFGDVFQLVADPGTSEESARFIGFDEETFPGTYEIIGTTAGGTPAYVEIEVTGPVSASVTLTSEPYAVWGGSGTSLTTGDYNLTITPYDEDDVAGSPYDIGLTVTDPPDPISVDSFTLVNATDDTTDGSLADGTVVPFTFDELSARADISGPVGSVAFELSRGATVVANNTDNTAPFSIFGDSGGNYSGQQFATDSYTLRATPYYGANGTGTAGTPLEIVFNIDAYTGETIEAESTSGNVTLQGFTLGSSNGETYAAGDPGLGDFTSDSDKDHPTVEANYIEFRFQVPETGSYRIILRAGKDGGNDSFWFAADSPTLGSDKWRNNALPNEWGNYEIRSADGTGNIQSITFAEGERWIRLHIRESGARIDKVTILPD